MLKVAHADDTNCLLAILPACLACVPGDHDDVNDDDGVNDDDDADDDNDDGKHDDIQDEGLFKITNTCFALAPKVITDITYSLRIKNMTIIIRIIITIIITIRMEHDDQDLRSS